MDSWFPHNISTFGANIDGVFNLIWYIVGVWFIAAELAIVYLVVRFRKREGQRAWYIRGETWRELSWILVPAVVVLMLDLAIDAAGARVWDEVKTNPPKGDVHLEVTGSQFTWHIVYPGPDGILGNDDDFSVDNELHIPIGKDIRVTLKAKDVLHSFFLPNMRLKQDAVPGRSIEVWFNATETGNFELACAELCGFGHYTMRGQFIVHSADDYERWVAERSAGA
jgi:cytochrome c oxidase subunit II